VKLQLQAANCQGFLLYLTNIVCYLSRRKMQTAVEQVFKNIAN